MIRLFTGVIAGALWITVILAHSKFLLWLVVTILGTIALKEYYTICLKNNEKTLLKAGVLTGIAPLVFSYSTDLTMVLTGLFVSFICQTIFVVSRFSSIEDPFVSAAKLCFGTVYIGLCASHLVLFLHLSEGPFWLFFLSIVIASSDTGAYYVGSSLGRVKLCPIISPGKTVEGFIGGLFFAAISASIFTKIFAPELDLIKIVFLAVIIAALSVIGDLTESIFKRSNHVKDSGNILPGHGGILDRVDSLLITAPVLFYILHLNLSSSVW